MPKRICSNCGKEKDVQGGKLAKMGTLFVKIVFMLAEGPLILSRRIDTRRTRTCK